MKKNNRMYNKKIRFLKNKEAKFLKNKEAKFLKNKKGLEMGFAWIFAIIAGAFILFIAIYTTINIIKTSRYEIDTRTAQELSILLDPLQTSFEALKATKVKFNSETRIYDECENLGYFGRQKISLAGKSRIGEEWLEPGGAKIIHNKYIFSKDFEQGKEMLVFSQPFKMPFKVADLIFLTSEKFCFKNPPDKIESELETINSEQFQIENCSVDSLSVCFGTGNCDINVEGRCGNCEGVFDTGYVIKEGESLYYSGNLFYAALISSEELYECNVKRLMTRLVSLCELYINKDRILMQRDCGSGLQPELLTLLNSANSFKESSDMIQIRENARILEIKNNLAICNLFEKYGFE